MNGEVETEFRGLAGQLVETPFAAANISEGILKRITTERYAWLTTVGGSGIPTPTLVWFRFDGKTFTVYSHPHSTRITHIFAHPGVSLHLESDGIGSGLVVVGGTASVTAEGADPRTDQVFWAKYHVEAELTGLTTAIEGHSTRITITPSTLWTTIPN